MVRLRSTRWTDGFLFSVEGRLQGECSRQVDSRFVQRELVDGRPEVQGVALGGTVGVEATEYLCVQGHRERVVLVLRLAMNGARPAPLPTTSLQALQPA